MSYKFTFIFSQPILLLVFERINRYSNDDARNVT